MVANSNIDEKLLKSAKKRLKVIAQKREEGNKAFKEGRLEEACRCYDLAIDVSGDIEEEVEDESVLEQAKGILKACRLNRAAIKLNTQNFVDCVEDCTAVIREDPDNAKALYRRGVAYSRNGDYERSKQDLNKALALSPDDPAIREEIASLKTRVANFKAEEKKRWSNVFAKKASRDQDVTSSSKQQSAPIVLSPSTPSAAGVGFDLAKRPSDSQMIDSEQRHVLPDDTLPTSTNRSSRSSSDASTPPRSADDTLLTSTKRARGSASDASTPPPSGPKTAGNGSSGSSGNKFPSVSSVPTNVSTDPIGNQSYSRTDQSQSSKAAPSHTAAGTGPAHVANGESLSAKEPKSVSSATDQSHSAATNAQQVDLTAVGSAATNTTAVDNESPRQTTRGQKPAEDTFTPKSNKSRADVFTAKFSETPSTKALELRDLIGDASQLKKRPLGSSQRDGRCPTCVATGSVLAEDTGGSSRQFWTVFACRTCMWMSYLVVYLAGILSALLFLILLKRI